ncbi:MAG: MetQ/NlpA family ABC transporter substrate-binding protein [Chloroflexota bacterium]|nr:MetQ/NlpA family ABC transporter substrate-binding protein [Chloroflexota bacterium]
MAGLLRIGLIGTVLVAIIVSGIACAGDEDISSIKFGVLPVVDTLPLLVADDEGFFEQENIDIEIIPFNSALERDAALQAGEINGYFADPLSAILMIDTDVDISMITVAYRANPEDRMFAIVASPESGFTELSQLKGVEVGISSATIIEYLLDNILAEHGFGEDDVKKLEVKQIPIRLQMLLSSEIEAALLPEPLVTLAESEGAKVLTDDRTLDTTLTILALDNSIMNDNRSLKERFLRAYGTAVDAINENPDGYRELLVANTRIPPEIEDEYVIPSFPLPDVPPEKDLAEVQDWLVQNGLIQEAIPYEEVVALSSSSSH